MGSIIGFTTPCLMFYLVGNKFFKSKPKEEKLNK
jgi:hypothetical protein